MSRRNNFLFMSVLSLVYVVDAERILNAFDQQLYKDVLDSEKCAQQLKTAVTDPELNFRFHDSSTKTLTGVLSGNLQDFGDYDRCLEISHEAAEQQIDGKYCMVHYEFTPGFIPEFPNWQRAITIPRIQNASDPYEAIKINNRLHKIIGLRKSEQRSESIIELGISVALCIPKVCTVKETIDFLTETSPTYKEGSCRLPNDKPFVAGDYTAFAVFGCIALLVILSTCYDLYQKLYRKNTTEVSPTYSSFSIYTNTQRFLQFTSSKDSLECIDGIRSLSMMWIVAHHNYTTLYLAPIFNTFDAIYWIIDWSSVWIISGPLAVDTFFLLSGLLVVYSTVGKISRGRFVKTLHLFYLGRLVRLFPILAFVVLLQATVINHVYDGPNWTLVATEIQNCRDHWWAALLHVQNYVNPLEVCVDSSWYLSVDTQLYFVCPILMVFLFGRKRIAWGMLAVFLLLSLVGSSLVSFLYNLPGTFFSTSRQQQSYDFHVYFYVNTLARAPPFVLGMIYGNILYLFKNKTVNISWITSSLLWLLSLSMMAFCVFIHKLLVQPDHLNETIDNLINAYMRLIWAFGVGWVIFACVKGYGGPINWFLSLPLWKLPARLSYAIYLIHLPIMKVVSGSLYLPYFFSDGNNIYRLMADLSLSFIFGFIICIFIDAPIANLYRIATGGYKKPKEPMKPIEEENPSAKIA